MQLVTDQFLAKLAEPREVKRPESFDSTVQSFRGVRSGVVRKIQAITKRITSGYPMDRVAREQDKRAAKFLLAAFGSIFHGHMGIHTIRNVLKSEDRFGKMLVVARHIWMQDAYKQLQAGEEISLEALFAKYHQTALHRLNTTIADNAEVTDDFLVLANLIEGWLSNQELRTNHDVLSTCDVMEEKNSVVDELKMLVRNETYARVDHFGWNVVKRIRARCYKALETGSLQAIFCVRGIIQRLKKGESSLGKRGKKRSVQYTPVSEALERHLIGLCRSTDVFLSRQFDVAILKAQSAGLL